MEEATDTEFWFAVCFQSRDQKDAFLLATGWMEQTGDSDKYLDGQKLAQALNVKLPPGPVWNRRVRENKRFAALAMDD